MSVMFCVALLVDSVCFVCCVFDNVCELFGEAIQYVWGVFAIFVVEYYGPV